MLSTIRYLWWDTQSAVQTPRRIYNYLPFGDIDDIIDQYNYVGFHDVCNYHGTQDVTLYKNPNSGKGVLGVMGGFTEQNQSGRVT